MSRFNDQVLTQARAVMREAHTKLDSLMANGEGYELMKAVTVIEIAAQLFQKRLTEIK